ncbi:hypothetical protein MCGE09_00320, partial [Thaumarchaeota archaeon SCGC AB-539-E09]
MVIIIYISFFVIVSKSENLNEEKPWVKIFSSKVYYDRLDVGRQQVVEFSFGWYETGYRIIGATVYINGQKYITDDSGVIRIKHTENRVKRVEWDVEKFIFEDHDLIFVDLEENPSCIFDKVMIELEPKTHRLNVGSNARVITNAYYAYDGAPFNGEIILNNTELKHNDICKKRISVIQIKDKHPKMKITKFESNIATIIWDKVNIKLSYPENKRISTGVKPNIIKSANYVYDNEVFSGKIIFNQNIIQNISGKYKIEVKKIIDDKYNVSLFDSNYVELIYDKVILDLDTSKNRIDVTEEPNITWNGYYEYDNANFYGT